MVENSTIVEIHPEEQMEHFIMELQFLDDHETARDSWIGATYMGREGKWYCA
jgi:hypothetical protein